MRSSDYSSFKTLEECVENIYPELQPLDPWTARRNEALKEWAAQSNPVKEFGIFQGSALAIMASAKPKNVIGLDINLSSYHKTMSTKFEDFAFRHNINLQIKKCSSLDLASMGQCDTLHIDSHATVKGNAAATVKNLLRELEMHNGSVSKYIMFHDILQNNNAIGNNIKKWLKSNSSWKIKEEETRGKCGFMVIEKK